MERIKVSLGVLVTVLSILLFGNVTVSAQSSVEVDQTADSIELYWSIDGDSFQIYRDGEKIWKGNEKEYIDKDLEISTNYSYKIGSFNDNGELLDIVTVKTSTTSPKGLRLLKTQTTDEQQSEVYNAIINSNVGTNYVELEWSELQTNNGKYKVYKDEQLIAEVSEKYYEDKNVQPGQTYVYTVVAETDAGEEAKQRIREELESRNLPTNQEHINELATKRENLINVVRTPEKVNIEELKGLSTPFSTDISPQNVRYSMLFRYTTFIPSRVEENKFPFHGGWLKGDNRGFSATSSKYRTRSDVYAGWSPAGDGRELRQERSVSETVLYEDKAGTKVDMRDTASASGIKFVPLVKNNSNVEWEVNHDVGVPFDPMYPNITYQYFGKLDSSYSGSIRGSHDKAPNHEIYLGVAYTGMGWTSLRTYTGQSFFNLLPGMPNETFNIKF
ncbi:hypothetical protein AQ616_17675 [Oceanobacillus sp. E9]|uniref:hypothetical protein n=1 Tax=Oceanobacillus sp. E9 TaxID=1742575 RepID=UPI00084EB000|nr:hypothetical protein [Oceanobacillus sp. E9]OEH53110.1 hypothetical protein AQ616_17675 [Oceanobacillus sp. E9]